uniref:Uncharacterized protein n=1 Tax=Rhizophora mucronata TaxID=61149 RepID=A0A2P2Q0P4_RHIMU
MVGVGATLAYKVESPSKLLFGELWLCFASIHCKC